MEKILSVFLAFVMTCFISSCNPTNENPPTDTIPETTETVTEPDPSAKTTDPLSMLTAIVAESGNETDDFYFYKLTTKDEIVRLIGASSDGDNLTLDYRVGYQYTGILGAFDLAVLDAGSPEKAEALAKEMLEHANTWKYVCMSAESVKTSVNGNLVLFVMSTQSWVTEYVNAFEALR